MSAVDLYRALWRHWAPIVVLTAIVGGGAWYGISRIAPTYEASTLVRIQQKTNDPTEVSGSLLASQALAQTYAQIVGSGALNARVERILTAQIPPHPVTTVSVTAAPVQDLELIWLTAHSRVPIDARRVANTVPVALREFIRSTSSTRDRVVIVKPASLPTSPSSPDKTLDLALAVVLGLIFNSVLVLLIDRLSDRLPDDLERAFGYPVIGTIPALSLVPVDPESRSTPPTATSAGASTSAPRE